jgi:LmbE family N-acetylglucosaminyl deacetylase
VGGDGTEGEEEEKTLHDWVVLDSEKRVREGEVEWASELMGEATFWK